MVDANGEWRLVRGTVDGVDIPIIAGSDITLTVDGSTIGGRSACNSYGGDVIVKDGQVQFGQLMMTEMACAEPVMASEAAYQAALGRIRNAGRDGDTLTLTGPGVELVFARVVPPPPASLTATDWLLDTLISGDTASSVADVPATLRLETDGSLRGATGCRAFTGRWQGSPPAITFSDLTPSEALPCPSTVATQDAQIMGVLEHATSAVADGGRLTISAGTQGLGYAAPVPVESGPA